MSCTRRPAQALEYDALVLALGARAVPRYKHAITIDDRRMDETLHGLIQDIEGGYVDSLAFVLAGPHALAAAAVRARAHDRRACV